MFRQVVFAAALLFASPSLVLADARVIAETSSADERAGLLATYREAHFALQRWAVDNPNSPIPLLSDARAAPLIRTGLNEDVLAQFPKDARSIGVLCKVSAETLGLLLPKTDEQTAQRSGELSLGFSFALSCSNLAFAATTASLEGRELPRTQESTVWVNQLRSSAARTFVGVMMILTDAHLARDDKLQLLSAADRNAAGFASIMTIDQRREAIAIIDRSTLWAGSAARRSYLQIREAMSRTDCSKICAYDESRRA